MNTVIDATIFLQSLKADLPEFVVGIQLEDSFICVFAELKGDTQLKITESFLPNDIYNRDPKIWREMFVNRVHTEMYAHSLM